MGDTTCQLIGDIVPDVRKTAELVQEISVTSDEQSASVQQVTKAVEEVSNAMQELEKVITQNSGAAEEMASTSEEMSAQAELLRQQIGFFKVEAEGGLSAPKAQKGSRPAAALRGQLALPPERLARHDARSPKSAVGQQGGSCEISMEEDDFKRIP
jgi:methyl-accepting chemotaxis protein